MQPPARHPDDPRPKITPFMLRRLIEVGQMREQGLKRRDIEREFGATDRAVQRWEKMRRAYPRMDLSIDLDDLPKGYEITSQLRRAQILGDLVISPEGTEVFWDPRSLTDCYPWVDDNGSRWAGSKLTTRRVETEEGGHDR